MNVLNYMLATYVTENTIYLTGGINKNLSDISPSAYIYNPEATTFQKLPDMVQERYTHFGLLMDKRLY